MVAECLDGPTQLFAGGKQIQIPPESLEILADGLEVGDNGEGKARIALTILWFSGWLERT
jgi:hypothetical protein